MIVTLPGLREPPLAQIDGTHQRWLADLVQRVDPARMRNTIETLPVPRSRLHSAGNIRNTEDLLVREFGRAGWDALRQPFVFTGASGWVENAAVGERFLYERLEGVNVLALREGELREEAVVVMAHYDTIRDTGAADDNTASVAALIELAHALEGERFRRTVLLAATDMEEIGFFGGDALAARVLGEYRVRAVVNFETMGYTTREPDTQVLPAAAGLLYAGQVGRIVKGGRRGDFTAIIHNGPGRGTAATLAAGLAHLAGPDAPVLLRTPADLRVVGRLLRRLVPLVRHFGRGDHVAFWEAGVPAVMVTDTADYRYPHYHKPTDTPEKLDYERLAAIVGATALAVRTIAEPCAPAAGRHAERA